MKVASVSRAVTEMTITLNFDYFELVPFEQCDWVGLPSYCVVSIVSINLSGLVGVAFWRAFDSCDSCDVVAPLFTKVQGGKLHRRNHGSPKYNCMAT